MVNLISTKYIEDKETDKTQNTIRILKEKKYDELVNTLNKFKKTVNVNKM